MQALGYLADQEAPRQRAEQYQFGAAGDLVKQPRQDEAADRQRHGDEQANAADRQQHDADPETSETRLHRQEQDCKDILQHQHAERNASRQGVEFAFFVQHLHDDDGAAQGTGNAEIECVEAAAADREPHPREEQDAEQAGARQLPTRGNQDHAAGAHDLLQIDFQADHEQHEDQAELGDDADRLLGLDQAGAEWTNEEPGDKVGEDQRLPEKMGQKPECPCEQDAKRDVANEFMHVSKPIRGDCDPQPRGMTVKIKRAMCHIRIGRLVAAGLACLLTMHVATANAQPAAGIERTFSDSLTTMPSENLGVSGAFYVPVYSSVSMSQGKLRADFSVTLSIHNASETRPLVLRRIAYFDTGGKLVESY